MILVDTSVWANHLRTASAQLQFLLEHRRVVMHPFVLGELACGNLPKRSEIITYLNKLPLATMASEQEVHHLLGSRRLWGTGLGWIDMHLLAAAAIGDFRLWSADRALASAAKMTGIEFPGDTRSS